MDKRFHVFNKDVRYDNLNFENRPWRPTLAYIIIGFLWIVFSDKLLSFMVQDIDIYEQMQTYKGSFYVLMTGVLLYLLIKLDNRKIFEITRLLSKKNEELVSFSEELIAMEEELQKKLAELNKVAIDLKHQSDFNEEIFNSSNMAMWIFRYTGEVLNSNKFCQEQFDWQKSREVHWTDYLLDEEDIEIAEIIKTVNNESVVTGLEMSFSTKVGETLILLCNMSRIVDPNTKEDVIVAYGTNITKERKNEKRLLELATTDTLTNLYNRAAFENDILENFEKGKRLAFFLIGLDNFKYLNDLYGHRYGDELLRQLSDAFKSSFSQSDIYRWGGDEFLIMKEMGPHVKVDSVASEIMRITKSKWEIFDIAYRSSASVGVVLYPDNGNGPRQIVANLDMALSHAKQSGKGQYQFVTDTFMRSIQYEAAMEKALKDAIAENKLKLIAQPIVDMRTEKVVSLEMLLRWPDNPVSERNIGKVISFAEKTGLIIAIDKWVIENTLKIVKAYSGRAPELKFAINISVQSFHAKNFIDFMQRKLEEHQVNPSSIELEITEYSLVKDMDRSLGTINSIKALGVGIALDDFGTKFSSLNYLSKMPFDILKIDKSYVDQILNESKDFAIIKNVVNLSRDIGLSTIVEGIEVQEQRDMLVEMGCIYGQGYLFSKPKDIQAIFEEFSL